MFYEKLKSTFKSHVLRAFETNEDNNLVIMDGSDEYSNLEPSNRSF